MIMSGQNLDATPRMKFFWQELMKLLQRTKMGRGYHPQIIRFALSLHGKSPSAYREFQESGAYSPPVKEFCGTIRTILSLKQVSAKKTWKACV